MALTALLFAHHGAGPDGEPPAMLAVAGISVIERQVRQARRCGADRVIVAVERMPPRLAATLAALGVEVVRTPDGFALDDDARVLVIEDALAIDRRVIDATIAKGGLAVAVWKGRAGPERSQRIDPATHWAGMSVYPGALVSRTVAGLGDWDLQETLLRAAFADDKPARVDVAAIDTYDADSGRAIPLLWQPVRSAADAAAISEAIFAAAEVGCPDWPARYVFSPIERPLVQFLVERGIDGGAVPAIFIALAATVAFGAGWLWIGLILALLTQPLVDLQSKLARIRDAAAPSTSARTVIALAECSWYFALAAHFALTRESSGPWALTVLTLLARTAIAGHAVMYRRFTGLPLAASGLIERRLQLFGAGRATSLWLLLPFWALGCWYVGLIAVAIYAVVTSAAVQVRFFHRLADYARAHSTRMASNLAAGGTSDFPILQRWLSRK